MISREKIVSLIQEAVATVLGVDAAGIRAEHSTPLFGEGGLLDSIALVAMIVEVEQRLDDEYGRRITLADDGAITLYDNPFGTVGSFAEYLEDRLGADGAA